MHWLRTIPALAQHYSVWAPDMPGFGDSDLPPEPYTMDGYAGIVERGLCGLLPDSVQLDVAGFSLGAGVAVRLARRLKGRFRHLVLSGVNFFPPSGLRRKLVSLRGIDNPTERMRGVKDNLLAMMLAHERNVNELALHLYSLDTARRRLPRVSFSGFVGMRGDLLLVHLQGRLTVISGADDQVIGHGKDGQAGALRSLRPDARYCAIEGGGHWVMYEAAERYNQALLDAIGTKTSR